MRSSNSSFLRSNLCCTSAISLFAKSSSVLWELCVTGSTPFALSIFGSLTAFCVFCPDTCASQHISMTEESQQPEQAHAGDRREAGHACARCVMNILPPRFSSPFPPGGIAAFCSRRRCDTEDLPLWKALSICNLHPGQLVRACESRVPPCASPSPLRGSSPWP